MRYAYYPGCSALNSAVELDVSTKTVAARLGLELETLREAACCGTREGGGLSIENAELSLALNARTLALAEAQGLNIITVCSTCQLKLAGDNKRLKEDRSLLEQINNLLAKVDLRYRGTVEVKHLLWGLLDEIRLQLLRDQITSPLKGLRVAPFYGCHLLRPGEVHGYRDDPYHPHSLDILIELVGGTPVDYSSKGSCCGFHSLLVSEKMALRMSGRHLREAKDKGADCLVTPCPLCHTVLDGYQREIEKEIGARLELPILHLPQLLGSAMGMKAKELQLTRHMVPARFLTT
ncbi:MAG: CoB--CoM heterodisulfide reductase iron-sulfur subunit B family protein [Chloroflexi bacterium]|nr:CoB--CoM heterodisulfide reductase iron-sulfur subunit B family protein [Chloroflexota bacterium]MCL5075882.1 CoB--CoM heterodisulfide reductase iron-sulfur subunit B family protein [Chloroflexota bacterium]